MRKVSRRVILNRWYQIHKERRFASNNEQRFGAHRDAAITGRPSMGNFICALNPKTKFYQDDRSEALEDSRKGRFVSYLKAESQKFAVKA